MILDRSTLRPIDVTSYLEDIQAIEGVALARFVVPFAKRAKELYRAQHGVDPLQRLEVIPAMNERRPVYAYVVDDLPLFDRAWRELATQHDLWGSRVSAAAGVIS